MTRWRSQVRALYRPLQKKEAETHVGVKLTATAKISNLPKLGNPWKDFRLRFRSHLWMLRQRRRLG